MQALKKMEKKDRLPKPLVECEIPIQLHQERSERLRGIEVRSEEGEARVLDMKDWARHCYVRYRIPMTRALFSVSANIFNVRQESQ